MSTPTLERIEELFHRAVELQPEARGRFLDAECGGDPVLRAAVEALLTHDQAIGTSTDIMASPIRRAPSANLCDTPTLKGSSGGPLPSGVLPAFNIPGYEIIDELGRGGMGVVYKARQLGLNRLVALKMLSSVGPVTSERLARFRLEAQSLGRLQHPNIVQIYEIGEHQGLPYFVMEFIDGPSLAQQMAGVPQPPRAAAHLVEILARAMAAVHRCGIIHRDLKPGNILLKDEGRRLKDEKVTGETQARPSNSSFILHPSSFLLKITDFGLAKRLEDAGAVTRTGSVMGTPDYMAPEQARGDIDGLGPWTDIYALGAILYEMVTGRPPFQGASPGETLARILGDEPISPKRWRSGMPRDLETICLKCLEKDRRRRYSSALDLAEDLRHFQAGEPIKARSVGILGRSWRWCRRQPVTAAALGVAGALAVTLIITVLAYNARLREALAREQELAEGRRLQLVRLDVNLGNRELENGDAFAALLWLTEAMKQDDANPAHRQRIRNVLEQIPWLLTVRSCDGRVLTSHCTKPDCWLAVEDTDHSVHIWDVQSGKDLAPPLKHGAGVSYAEFSSDGKLLATISQDGTVRIWQWGSGQVHQFALPAGTAPRRLVFSANGRFLLTHMADATVREWDAGTGNAIALPSPLESRGHIDLLSSDGRFVFSVDGSMSGYLWDTAGGKLLKAQIHLEPGAYIGGVSRDGQLAALVDKNNLIWIIETATGNVRGRPLAHAGHVSGVSFGPTGHHLLVAADRQTDLWQLADGQAPLLQFPKGAFAGWTQFSPDEHFLVGLGNDQRLRIWNVATRKAATPPLHPSDVAHYAAFCPDTDQLLLVGQDRTVRLWDLTPCSGSLPLAGAPGPRRPGHVIHPGIDEEFTLPQLAALVESLAGARVSDRARISSLNAADQVATWQRFRSYQMVGSP